MIKIYKISHPLSDKIYIGKTGGTLKHRLGQHTSEKRTKKLTSWIKSLSKKGLVPNIELIEEVDDSIWQIREKYWIKLSRQVMPGLVLNHLDGGEIDRTGIKHTNKSKQKMSDKLKGKSAWNKGLRCEKEIRQKISNSLKGNIISEETKIKISKSLKGRKTWNNGLTKELDERINKINAKRMGSHLSEETKKKMSDSKIGNKNCVGRKPWNKGKKKVSDTVLNEIILKFKSGMSRYNISKQYNINQRVIYDYTRDITR